MERRRHARTPVDLNAMLIGQKTVPKGCRVRNVSQQGMLLQCEPDGRLLTFSKGDKVEIHLTVGYAGEKKSLTIPSSVRHVNEAYIYVEFQHPDLKLVELIESYRASEAYELEAAVGFGGNRPTTATVTPITDTAAAMQAAAAPQLPEEKGSHKPFYYGLLTLVLVICIIAGGYIYTTSVDSRLDMLETITDRQSSELIQIRERAFSSTLQEGRYASLNSRMTALTDAFTSLDNKLTRLISQRLTSQPIPAASGDSPGPVLPPFLAARQEKTKPAASRPAEEAPEAATPGEQAETPSADHGASTQISALPAVEISTAAETAAPPQPKVSTTGSTSAAAADETNGQAATTSQEAATQATGKPAVTDKQGPWVINLLSSLDKNFVEQSVARAQSRGVDVEMNSAEVKGRVYWRMQITGFSTARAAKTGATPVKKKLGINDVWIFKR